MRIKKKLQLVLSFSNNEFLALREKILVTSPFALRTQFKTIRKQKQLKFTGNNGDAISILNNNGNIPI